MNNLKIEGHNLPITGALQEYVYAKIQRVKRHFDQVVNVRVLLTGTKKTGRGRDGSSTKKAEVTLRVKGKDIHIEHRGGCLYQAIDVLMGKLDRQLTDHKSRRQRHAAVRTGRLVHDSAGT